MTSLKKKEVLQIMLGNNDMNITVDSILTKIAINKSDVGCKGLERLKNALNSLKSKRNAKYQHCSRKIAVFESQNSEWLDSEFTIPDLDLTAKISKTEILKRNTEILHRSILQKNLLDRKDEKCLNHELLQRFKVILISLSCHLPLDSSRFEEFCTSTAKLYVSLYSWYPMSQTVHKILIHSGEIIKNSILPVDMLGEEASEARNKDYKKFRLQHSRKHSRMANLEDLFCRAIDTSDPLLSSLRLKERLQQKVQLSLPKEVQLLLKEVEVDSNQSGSTNYVQMT
ncbi:uncharacterized protein LOC128859715 [Anastrepha ludens]|uniref:uncharacterized protein LOC128859715 n=1 Tax=Anastrepha ludens TaxID=28586 RepID=UPI0023AE920C|nr:uncharacterized protein LOC128859715 [Anastrepha ludens]